MKKTILILMLLSLVLCLGAQQSEQIKPKKTVTATKKKMNYELEYINLNGLYKNLQTREHNLRIKWQQLDNKHQALIKSSQTNKSEVVALKKTNVRLRAERKDYRVKWEALQTKHNGFQGKYQKLRAENNLLKKENARLKAELEEYKPKKKTVKKTVTKG